jgi:hypothetical protein
VAENSDTKRADRSAVQAACLSANEKPDDALARTITRPEVQSGALIQALEQENYEVNAVIRQLEAQTAAVQSGDLKRGEAMLTAQAHALDALFGNLARRAARNLNAGHRDACEQYLRLAFKAQAQCRVTWEAIAEIKNPRPVAFVKQANIAHGPQQVNNGPAPAALSSRAEQTENPPSKLLESENGKRMDTGTASAPGRANQELEIVGAIHRAAHARGQGQD